MLQNSSLPPTQMQIQLRSTSMFFAPPCAHLTPISRKYHFFVCDTSKKLQMAMCTCGHISSWRRASDSSVSALPRMYIPWRARLSSTLTRFLIFRKPTLPLLQDASVEETQQQQLERDAAWSWRDVSWQQFDITATFLPGNLQMAEFSPTPSCTGFGLAAGEKQGADASTTGNCQATQRPAVPQLAHS